MKKKILFWLLIFAVIVSGSIATASKKGCKMQTVHQGIEIFTEANLATNYVVTLSAGDVLYICGE